MRKRQAKLTSDDERRNDHRQKSSNERAGVMILCNNAAAWRTGTEDVVCWSTRRWGPVSPRNPTASQQTENPTSPAAARGNEQGIQRRKNAGGPAQTLWASRAKRRAQDSSTRLKGSGHGSGRKRLARVWSRRSLDKLQRSKRRKLQRWTTRSSSR
ncbi:unnamed protein product [Ectocarpus sp. 12 AP-2014]